MIPYAACFDFYHFFFDMLPFSFKAFFAVFLLFPAFVHAITWFVGEVLG